MSETANRLVQAVTEVLTPRAAAAIFRPSPAT
jgi:hypothetical protein